MPQLSIELEKALKTIIDEFETDEKPVRERQIRVWKKLWYYWCGFTRVYWDDVAHDWRSFGNDYSYETNGMEYYDKPFNVFRAYLESIIAALSATVPQLKFLPDDANSTSDVLTARAATKISQLIYKHNDAPLLFCKALFVYCTQGMVAAYNYCEEDYKFGSVNLEEYEEQEEEIELQTCPICKMDLELSQAMQLMNAEKDEFDPGDDDAVLHSLYQDGKIVCPNCAVGIDPEIKKDTILVPRLVGVTNHPKSRQCIEVNGGLFIKVPNWARSQKEIPYLAYCYETHYTNVYKRWPHLKDTLPIGSDNNITASGNEQYERWGRLSPQYYGEYPRSTPTVRNWWLRTSAFEVLRDKDIIKQLKKKFPDGVRAIWINEEFAEARNESLDDHWTLTYNPLSEYIHFDPLGLLVTSVQEITQDLISLTLQTIEHGVPQVFADPTVLNFDQYRNNEVMPGGVYPARNKAGKSLGDGFFTISTATLSQEVMPFANQVQSLGQFVSGALPSLWGGQSAKGSETASEYSMSRNQSMQRLQVTWKMFNYWWKRIFSKVVPAYIKDMKEDERIVKEVHGQFINLLIRQSELDGKLGDVEAESSDQLPSTFGQVKDTLMQLIEMNNPQILELLGSAENIGVMQEYLGVPGIVVNGEYDREKQYEEISMLLKTEPVPGGMDPMGQPQEMPSVMPEFEVDNHKVEGDICRSWLVSEFGREAKVNNPKGYKNVMLHLKIHIQMLQSLSAPPAPPQEPMSSPVNKLRPVNTNVGN